MAYKIETEEKYPFSTMEPGDSFWRSARKLGSQGNLHQSKTARAMRQFAHQKGMVFSASVERNKKDKPGMRFARVS